MPVFHHDKNFKFNHVIYEILEHMQNLYPQRNLVGGLKVFSCRRIEELKLLIYENQNNR